MLDSGGYVGLQLDAAGGRVDFPARHETAYAIRQTGDALDPFARHGDYIVIDPEEPTQPGDNVLIRRADGAMILARLRYRRDGRVYLDSLSASRPAPAPLDDIEVDGIEYVAACLSSRYWSSGE